MSRNVHREDGFWYDEEFAHSSSGSVCTRVPVEEPKKKKKNDYTRESYEIQDYEIDNTDKDFQVIKSPKTGDIRVVTPYNCDDEAKQRELGMLIQQLRISNIKRREEELKEQEQLRQQAIKKKNPTETERSPPIYVHNVDPIELKDVCKFAIGDNFLIGLLCRDVYMVYCHTMEQYETIQRILEQSKKQFSLTANPNIYRRMALYGVDPCTPPAELLSLLKQFECDLLKFINVKFFRTRRGPGYVVNISFDSRVDLLKNVDIINNQPVTWEAYILQCYNCQEYGHRGSRCRFEPRCVKCAGYHLSSDCPIKKEGFVDKRFKCIICDEKGHTADFKECPWFKIEQRQLMYNGQPISDNASETKRDEELREMMCSIAEQLNSLHAQMQGLTNKMEEISSEVGKRCLKNS